MFQLPTSEGVAAQVPATRETHSRDEGRAKSSEAEQASVHTKGDVRAQFSKGREGAICQPRVRNRPCASGASKKGPVKLAKCSSAQLSLQSYQQGGTDKGSMHTPKISIPNIKRLAKVLHAEAPVKSGQSSLLRYVHACIIDMSTPGRWQGGIDGSVAGYAALYFMALNGHGLWVHHASRAPNA